MPTPHVSICIPTYRGAAHLGATIDSVLAQTCTNFELVIVDDQSPDDTEAIIRRYTDPRIRYLKNERNLGPEGNWNRCLEEARGALFKLLPQDDLIYPDTLARQVDILERDADERLALVFGARNITNANGRTLTTRGCPGAAEGCIDAAALVRRCVRMGTNLIGEPGSVLMRTSLAHQVGKFDGSLGYVIDLDYWVRLLAHGDAYYLERPVSSFRVSGGSWSVAIGSRQSEEYRRFIARVAAQSRWHIGRIDALTGNIMARANNVMRLVFYRWVLHH
ncbi:MAG: glycosyltransferase [Thiobacillus sp.]|nr:glycosyltransferase [Thiobacillus sp.]